MQVLFIWNECCATMQLAWCSSASLSSVTMLLQQLQEGMPLKQLDKHQWCVQKSSWKQQPMFNSRKALPKAISPPQQHAMVKCPCLPRNVNTATLGLTRQLSVQFSVLGCPKLKVLKVLCHREWKKLLVRKQLGKFWPAEEKQLIGKQGKRRQKIDKRASQWCLVE